MAGYHNNLYEFDKSELFFVHIPKTGGTSIAEMCDMISVCGLNIGKNYRGHYPVSLIRNPEEYRYITSIRDPIQRVWSYYNMVSGIPGYPHYEFTSNLELFMENCWEVRNMMTKYLTGYICDELSPHLIDYGDNTLLPKNSVEIAIKNLSNFYFVFDFDNLEESNTKFINKIEVDYKDKSHVGELLSSKFPHERRSRQYNLPNPKEIEIIERYNRMDILLYNHWSS